ncbi:MAG: cell division protein FtsA [Alloprevotella sp.]|nr:cell division protein FtsA [Alloprevotella sp.]
MTHEDHFIVAIELGSSKITAIAGRKQPDGNILILAYVQEPSESFIRKGRIYNFNKTTSCIESMKHKLEERLNKAIGTTYVGIGGMGLHTVSNTVSRQLSEKLLITQQMVNSVIDANNATPGNDREILAVVPQDYKLGAQTVADPVGIATESIEGHFLNVIASATMTKDVQSCFLNAGLRVESTPISVLSLADAILTEPEKRSGCVFVDMGAETTSVAIYKNNVLRHLAVLPLGGASINRDLMGTLQIEDAEAEALKRKFGTAYRADQGEDHAPISLSDGRHVKYDEFSGLVEARVEEIVANINNQIALSKHDKTQLIAGIIITGGAAAIKDMDKAIKEYTGIDKIRFVKNMHLQYRFEDKAPHDFNADGSFNAAIALIDKGEVNCCAGDLGDSPTIAAGQPAATTAGTTPAGSVITGTTPATPADAPIVTADVPATPAEEPEEKPREEKPKKPNALKKLWSKLSTAAGRLVSEDEDKFPHSNER